MYCTACTTQCVVKKGNCHWPKSVFFKAPTCSINVINQKRTVLVSEIRLAFQASFQRLPRPDPSGRQGPFRSEKPSKALSFQFSLLISVRFNFWFSLRSRAFFDRAQRHVDLRMNQRSLQFGTLHDVRFESLHSPAVTERTGQSLCTDLILIRFSSILSPFKLLHAISVWACSPPLSLSLSRFSLSVFLERLPKRRRLWLNSLCHTFSLCRILFVSKLKSKRIYF